jgi:hypothetical protein
MRLAFAAIVAYSLFSLPVFGFHRPIATPVKTKPKVDRYVPGHGRTNPVPPLTVI